MDEDLDEGSVSLSNFIWFLWYILNYMDNQLEVTLLC